MHNFTQRLRRLIELESVHCGRDEDVKLADRHRVRLEKFTEAEISRLAKKAGEA